jgi:hypothetical protein
VIDTVNDVVLGDVGDEIVSTGGVAVRPFWWSTECLVALGLATDGDTTGTTGAGDTSDTGSGGSAETTGSQGGTGSTGDGNDATGGGSGEGDAGGDVEALADGGLSGGWIALIAVLAAVAVAALAVLAFVLGRGRRRGPDTTTRSSTGDAAATTVATGATAQELRTTPAFCSECGGTLAPGARFCPGCGRRL